MPKTGYDIDIKGSDEYLKRRGKKNKFPYNSINTNEPDVEENIKKIVKGQLTGDELSKEYDEYAKKKKKKVEDDTDVE